MNNNAGISIKGLKQKNQSLILKLIATRSGLSRIDLAKISHLTKMTVSNIIADLIDRGIVAEEECHSGRMQPSNGRIPTPLKLSPQAPKIIGILIKRGLYQVILGDLSGNILDKFVDKTQKLAGEKQLLDIIFTGIDTLKARNNCPLLAVGIASIGPLDAKNGIILDPPNFWGIQNLPIVQEVTNYTKLPPFSSMTAMQAH